MRHTSTVSLPLARWHIIACSARPLQLRAVRPGVFIDIRRDDGRCGPRIPRSAPAGRRGQPAPGAAARQAVGAMPGSGRVHGRWRSTTASKVWPGRAGSVGVGGVDAGPAGGGIGGEDLQHRRGQVHGGDPVSLPGQQQGQEPGACPGVQHRGGRGRPRAAQRGGPRRQLLRAPRVVRRRGVVTGRVVVSEPAGLLRDAGSRHARPACLVVVPVAGRVSPAPLPWRCPIFARSCRSARRTRRRPRSRRRYRR